MNYKNHNTEKKSKIYTGMFLFLSIIFILNSQLLFIEPIFHLFSPINNYHNKLLISLLAIFSFLIYAIRSLLSKRNEISMFDFIILLFPVLSLLILVFQILTSAEPKAFLIGNAYYNFIVLLYFPLKDYITSINKFIKVLRMLIIIGFAYTLSTIVLFFLIKDNILTSLPDVTLIQYVNGKLRLPQTADLIGLTSILSLCYLLYLKQIRHKTYYKYLFVFLICFITLIFISIVRMMALTVFVSFIIIIYFEVSKKIKKILLISILCFTSLLVILISQKFNILTNFLGEGQQLASAMYRFQVIEHFSKHMFDNGFFGFGYSQEVISKYSITDIGILGFLFKYGVIGAIWLLLLVKSIKWKIDNSFEKTFSLGLVVFMSLSFISLSMFDAQRITFLPILFAILDFLTRSMKNEILLCDTTLSDIKRNQ